MISANRSAIFLAFLEQSPCMADSSLVYLVWISWILRLSMLTLITVSPVLFSPPTCCFSKFFTSSMYFSRLLFRLVRSEDSSKSCQVVKLLPPRLLRGNPEMEVGRPGVRDTSLSTEEPLLDMDRVPSIVFFFDSEPSMTLDILSGYRD